jgi:HK97 family phage major capsid protein
MKKFNRELLLKELDGVKQIRSFSFNQAPTENKTRGVFDKEKRLVEFSLSSEAPYQRYFGMEILGHNEDEIDMSRLMNGAPLLLDHDMTKVIGVVESARVENSRIIVVARFSKNALATEIFNDVVDGIRGKISVGYFVKDMKEISEKDAEIPSFRVTSWLPFESSSVGIAADDFVGIGRSLEDKKAEPVIEKALETPVPVIETAKEVETVGKQTEILIIKEVKKMADTETLNKNEVQSILAMGKQFKKSDEAAEWISQGKSADGFKDFILNSFEKDKQAFVAPKTTELGMTEKEKKSYDVMNIVRYLAGDEGADAGFEKELSQEIAKKQNITMRSSKSFLVPSDILTMSRTFNEKAFAQIRAMNAGTTTAGGHTVATILEAGSMIDVLRNSLAIGRLGATYLTGLNGIIDIPRVTVATTGSWVAENGSAAEGSVTMDKVTMSQKTATGHTTTTRLLRSQSSIDINNFVLNELFKTISVTIDSAGINGTGSSNQPTGVRNQSGINTVATDTNGSAPTYGLFVDMETAIANDNADQGTMKYLINTKTRGACKKTPKVTALDHYIYEKGMINDLEAVVSNQVPSNITKAGGSNLSTALCGYWPDLLIGLWGSFEISIDDKYYATDGRHRIVAFQDYDVAVRHAESFCEMSGIITT